MITESYLIEHKEAIEHIFNDYLGDLNGVKFIRGGERDTCPDKLCCMFEVDDSRRAMSADEVFHVYLVPCLAAVAREIGEQPIVRFMKPPLESHMVGELGYVTFDGLIPFRIVIQDHRVTVDCAVDSG